MPLTEEQRALRRQGIGASEIAAIAGLNPYQKPIDVWLEKTGRAEPFAGSEATEMGHRLEPVIAQWYCEQIGASRYDTPSTLVHPDHPWMIATPDLVASRAGRDRRCEIKHVGMRVRQHWRAGEEIVPPDYVIAQCLWQGLVSGIEDCDVAVWLGTDPGNQHIIEVEWLPDVAADLVEIGDSFWRDHVLADVPPAVDDSESWSEYAKRAWPANVRAELVEAVPEADHWAKQIIRCSASIKQLEAVKRESESAMKAEIQDRDGIFREGPWRWRATWKLDTQGRVNWRGVAEELGAPAELIEKHRGAPSRRFLFREDG